jgi:hypothetical protein
MNAKELAQELNALNLQYPTSLPQDLVARALASGLVIVQGVSDDGVGFDGAITAHIGAFDGVTAMVHPGGLLPRFESIKRDDKEAFRSYFQHEPKAVALHALWCAEPGYSWTFSTNIAHETFEIAEDGEPFCRGIVFALKDATTEPKIPPRRVVCAANRLKDGTLILGVRHFDKFMHEQIDKMGLEDQLDGHEQGFVDQFGVFMTREQAHPVAVYAKQIIRRCGGDERRLYSENLY